MMARFKDNKQTFRNFVMVFEFGNNYKTHSHVNVRHFRVWWCKVICCDLGVWPHPVRKKRSNNGKETKKIVTSVRRFLDPIARCVLGIMPLLPSGSLLLPTSTDHPFVFCPRRSSPMMTMTMAMTRSSFQHLLYERHDLTAVDNTMV